MAFYFLCFQSKLNSKKVPLKNSDNENLNVNSPKSETQILVSDNVVEINFSKGKSAEDHLINKPIINASRTEKI